MHHKIYLEKLYPFYFFDKKPIKFPKVQLQTNIIVTIVEFLQLHSQCHFYLTFNQIKLHMIIV